MDQSMGGLGDFFDGAVESRFRSRATGDSRHSTCGQTAGPTLGSRLLSPVVQNSLAF
jgi:hypothetical protein